MPGYRHSRLFLHIHLNTIQLTTLLSVYNWLFIRVYTLPNMGQSPGQHFQFKQISHFINLDKEDTKFGFEGQWSKYTFVLLFYMARRMTTMTITYMGHREIRHGASIEGINSTILHPHWCAFHMTSSLVQKEPGKGNLDSCFQLIHKPHNTTPSSQIYNWNLRSLVGNPNSSRLLLQKHYQ